MQVAFAAQVDPTPLIPGRAIDPVVSTSPSGSTKSNNSVFDALLNSLTEMPATPGPQTTVPKSPHPNSDPKPEHSKKIPQTVSQDPVQAANVASDIDATPRAASNASGSPGPAQASSPQPAQDTVTSKPALNGPNLAFAIRVTPAAANSTPALPPKQNGELVASQEGELATRNVFSTPGSPAVSAVQQRQADTAGKDGQEFAGGEQQPTVLTTQLQVKASTSAAAGRPDFDSELKNATAVRGAHIQLVGNGNQRVEIQLLERGGGLAVSVRSSDTMLTRTLQDHIPELTTRLDSEHLRSEAWTPAAGNSSGNRDPRNGGSFTGQGSSWSGSGQQQRQSDGQKPKWVQELEENQNKVSSKETFYVSSN